MDKIFWYDITTTASSRLYDKINRNHKIQNFTAKQAADIKLIEVAGS
jgi:hypothetical protein